MFHRFLWGLALLIFLAEPQAFALSDPDYNALKASSPEFKKEDQKLCDIYKELMGELKGDYKKSVRNGQRQWLKTELDAEAKGYMDEGMSKGKAYAKATHRRYNVLRVIQENSRLSKEDVEAGRVKDDDYYNAVEDGESDDIKEVPDDLAEDLPENCGTVKLALPVEDTLNMILLENGKGEKLEYYYYRQPGSDDADCGKIAGVMCFDILKKLPVTSKLRSSGVKGEEMTIINECRAAN